MANHVAFIGSGLIGTGLALNCITHGVPVVLQTRSQTERVKNRMAEGLDFYVEHGIITAEEKEKAASLITITTSVEDAVKDARFIQESGPDSVELKHQIIAQIEAVAPADAREALGLKK